MAELVGRLLGLLTVGLARWAGKQFQKTANIKQRDGIARQALNEIAPYGATQAELEQAYKDIVDGAAPASVILHYRQIAQSRKAS